MPDDELDPLIHQANRLRIMTTLYKENQLAVTTLRDALHFTDGNLASHLSKLEAAGYIKQGRVLAGLAFELHVKITDAGTTAFRDYLAKLRSILESAGGTTSIPEAPRPGVVDLGRQNVA